MKRTATFVLLAITTMWSGGEAGLLAAQAEPSANLRVTEFGVGTGVKARELVGKSDSFPEGTRVWFWTRVVGGVEGERLRHVWIREGKEVFSIGLAVGGSHWRTYSNKTLSKGSVGSWIVEARGSDDRVLARQAFACTVPQN